MNGRAGVCGHGLGALPDPEVELDVTHEARVAVRESQIADVGPLSLRQLSICWVDHLSRGRERENRFKCWYSK